MSRDDRVKSTDPEDLGATGTVLRVTPTGGVEVAWDDGGVTWTTADRVEAVRAVAA